jgi:hypothetical protein
LIYIERRYLECFECISFNFHPIFKTLGYFCREFDGELISRYKPVATGQQPVKKTGFLRLFDLKNEKTGPLVQLQPVAVWSGPGLFSGCATGPGNTRYVRKMKIIGR